MTPRTARARAPRTPLSRQRVLHAAAALADESGLEALSMRKLGEAVGVEAMSLYTHIANKDDLLDGMIDTVFSEIELPSGEDDWRTAMRQRAISVRRVLSRHRWAIGLMESRSSPGPATLRHHDADIGCLSQCRLLRRADRPRVLGPRQLHLRVRPAGAQPAVRHSRRDRGAGAGHHDAVPDRRVPAPGRADDPARAPARLRLR